MGSDWNQLLTERIMELDGVESKPRGAGRGEGFYIGGEEFLHFHSDNSLHLKLNEACKQRMGDALKSERRAQFDNNTPEWVEFTYGTEIDAEIVLVYVRNAYKLIRADVT